MAQIKVIVSHAEGSWHHIIKLWKSFLSNLQCANQTKCFPIQAYLDQTVLTGLRLHSVLLCITYSHTIALHFQTRSGHKINTRMVSIFVTLIFQRSAVYLPSVNGAIIILQCVFLRFQKFLQKQKLFPFNKTHQDSKLCITCTFSYVYNTQLYR